MANKTARRPRRLEVVGVRAGWWAERVGAPTQDVLFTPEKLGSREPFWLARYLSAGLDDGAVDYSRDVAGGTLVRDADTGEVLARYSGGEHAVPQAQPFAELPADEREVEAEFVPTIEVVVGDRLVGGTVTAIRRSPSGKSVWFTLHGARGESEWPRESTRARTAVFTVKP